ncbi:SDR family oxidoreductase [Paenibacillus sp. N1-5-1-14]|uniref:SDR family NAD(P)-dependent oxidoreductase n=1 Tax=Paenibacillus radicibacter TaxID=2972488 RepID=UPI0021592E5E|nr:SDR family oxidoreductase [Paenibacillus radicibacter]MCR8642878.1 SDR family oxidoreductase [Paenibacillus radicibacter]
MSLKGQVAIITSGSSGIGRASALLLAQRGAKVIVHYSARTASQAAEAVVAEIQALGGKAVAVQADLLQENQVQELVLTAKETFGSIDILVCHTPSYAEAKPFAEMSWELFAKQMNDELQTAFLTTQAVIPHLIERRSGRIVYVSSTLGKDPSPHMIAQGTAKGGLNTFALYIAQEFGPHGITANVVAPEHVHLDEAFALTKQEKQMLGSFTPLGRVAEPEDVASVIAFLASEDALFLSGTYTPVTGGLTMEG